jgi:hypothetical protein
MVMNDKMQEKLGGGAVVVYLIGEFFVGNRKNHWNPREELPVFCAIIKMAC